MAGLLTLDLATVTGWAHLARPEAAPDSGIFDGRAPDGNGALFVAFHDWLEELMDERRPKVVYYEAPFAPSTRNANVAQRLFGLPAILLMLASRRNVARVTRANNASVKKHFTGNGRAEKADTIFRCGQLGWDPQDDNEADALALLHYACCTEEVPGWTAVAIPQSSMGRAA